MDKIAYYLDYAAATPVDDRVFKEMIPYFSDNFFNPSSPYDPAIQVKKDYNDAKDRIAKVIGARGQELVMTAGATESINLAINSFSGHKICSRIEHDSVINAIKNTNNFDLVDVGQKGRIIVDDIIKKINDSTELVSVALANHELGTIQPVAKLAKEIDKIRNKRLENGNQTPLFLHCDASQGLGILDVNVSRLGVDLMTLNAGKVYGPKQVGALWIKKGVKLTAQINGGGQENNLRSGTENVPGVIGFARAIELAEKKRKGEFKRLGDIKLKMQNKILEEIGKAEIIGDSKSRLASFLHVSFPGIDAERIVFMLENEGVYLSTGSACSANKGSVSRVLKSIGISEDLQNGSLRMTLGRFSTEENSMVAVEKLIKAVEAEYDRVGIVYN